MERSRAGSGRHGSHSQHSIRNGDNERDDEEHEESELELEDLLKRNHHDIEREVEQREHDPTRNRRFQRKLSRKRPIRRVFVFTSSSSESGSDHESELQKENEECASNNFHSKSNVDLETGCGVDRNMLVSVNKLKCRRHQQPRAQPQVK